MNGRIAVNTKHTGDPKKDHRGYAETMTGEQLDQLLSEPWLKQMVADIRAGNESVWSSRSKSWLGGVLSLTFVLCVK